MPELKDRANHAYEELRERIVWGNLSPGSRLIEQELAGRLGVSRTPVREALRRLEQEGYVQYDRDTGRSHSYVAPLTREDATELFLIIGAVEGLAARGAARLEPAVRTELSDRLEDLNRRLGQIAETSRPNESEIFDLDRAFHGTYVDAGGGARLRSLHESIKPQAERYTRVYISALVSEIHTSVEEHERIISGIKKGRANDAKTAVETNWRNAGSRLGRVIDQIGERGSW